MKIKLDNIAMYYENAINDFPTVGDEDHAKILEHDETIVWLAEQELPYTVTFEYIGITGYNRVRADVFLELDDEVQLMYDLRWN